MIKPRKLSKGDNIGVIAPAGPVTKVRLKRGIKGLKRLGYEVKLAENVWGKTGYLAGSDQERTEAINRMFADPEVKAVICARGGYGSLRILEELDYSLIRRNPKIFVGFSDITILHLAIHKLSGLVTFHGPMLAVGFDNLSRYNLKYFLRAVGSIEPIGRVQNSKKTGARKVISEGKARAPILGGNLTLITRLLGTRYEPDFRGKILFLEDLNEDVYKIDGMLAQLKLAGILKSLKGVVLAEFIKCLHGKRASFSLDEVFGHYFARAEYPVIYPVSCGHGKDKLTIPLGVKVRIDTQKKMFSIEETGVR